MRYMRLIFGLHIKGWLKDTTSCNLVFLLVGMPAFDLLWSSSEGDNAEANFIRRRVQSYLQRPLLTDTVGTYGRRHANGQTQAPNTCHQVLHACDT